MKLITVVQAKEALKRLTEKRFADFKVARKLVALRKQVETETDFYIEQEKLAVETYAEKTEDGTPVFLADGRVKLKDTTAKAAFEADIKKLMETEVDTIAPLTIKEKDFQSDSEIPSPSDMIALEGIVNFAE